MLINMWMGSTFVYVLILLKVSFPPFRGALVGSLPCVPPSPAVLGQWLSQEVAGLYPSMLQGCPRCQRSGDPAGGGLCQSRAANLREPERDCI